MGEIPQRPRSSGLSWLAALSSITSALGMVVMGLLWLSGVWAAPIKTQLESILISIDRIQAKLETLSLIPSQITSLDAHTHALDGRADATETRLRDVENRINRLEVRVSGIEDASRAALNGRAGR